MLDAILSMFLVMTSSLVLDKVVMPLPMIVIFFPNFHWRANLDRLQHLAAVAYAMHSMCTRSVKSP
jgi:hypothetical protein